jgi:hypothetical protein
VIEFPFNGFVDAGHRRGRTFVEYWYDDISNNGKIEFTFRGKEIALNQLDYNPNKGYILELRRSGPLQREIKIVSRGDAINYYISIMQQYFKFTIVELTEIRIRLTQAFNQCCDELEKNYPIFRIMNL